MVLGQDVERLPQYPGGESAFYAYVKKEMKYPAESKKKGIHGKVWIEFYVNVDGTVDPNTVKIIHGFTEEMNDEAKRLIVASKGWIPGKFKGKPSKEKLIIPVPFVIEEKK
jgi:protein TonB